MVFQVVRYESWIIKKDECRRIYALELCGWRRFLRIPWTAGRSNQSILQEGLMLKLELQYFGNVMQAAATLEKSLMLRKIEGRRRRGHQRMKWLDGITDDLTWTWANSGRRWGQGDLVCCCPCSHKEWDTTVPLNINMWGSYWNLSRMMEVKVMSSNQLWAPFQRNSHQDLLIGWMWNIKESKMAPTLL